MDMDWPTTDTMGTPTPTPMVTTMARGPLMLSPMPTTDVMDMDWPTTDMDMDWPTTDTMVPTLTPTPMVTTTARGPLMLSPRPMPTTDITTATPHTDMPTVVTM